MVWQVSQLPDEVWQLPDTVGGEVRYLMGLWLQGCPISHLPRRTLRGKESNEITEAAENQMNPPTKHPCQNRGDVVILTWHADIFSREWPERTVKTTDKRGKCTHILVSVSESRRVVDFRYLPPISANTKIVKNRKSVCESRSVYGLPGEVDKQYWGRGFPRLQGLYNYVVPRIFVIKVFYT